MTRDILSGFAYIKTHRCVWQLMIFTATFWTAAGVFKSTLTAVVFDWYGLGVWEWGIFQATLGVGMVLGAVRPPGAPWVRRSGRAILRSHGRDRQRTRQGDPRLSTARTRRGS